MQRGDTAEGRCVGVGARLDEVDDRGPLAVRIPTRRARRSDDGRMQRLGAPTVPGPDVGASFDEVPGDVAVVGERSGVQPGVAFVDLGETCPRKNSSARPSRAVTRPGMPSIA